MADMSLEMSLEQTVFQVSAAYDEVADSYADAIRGTAPEADLDRAMIEHFVALLPERRRVLDAGCGAGRMLPHLGSLGCEVTGLDLSPGMVRRAKVDHPTYSVQVGSLQSLPFGDDSFDGHFAWYSTIHGDDADLAASLAEAQRVVVAGGLLLLAFQSGAGVRDIGPVFDAYGHHIRLLRHSRTVADVVPMLARCGLAVVSQLERAPVGTEREPQAVVIARVRP